MGGGGDCGEGVFLGNVKAASGAVVKARRLMALTLAAPPHRGGQVGQVWRGQVEAGMRSYRLRLVEERGDWEQRKRRRVENTVSPPLSPFPSSGDLSVLGFAGREIKTRCLSTLRCCLDYLPFQGHGFASHVDLCNMPMSLLFSHGAEQIFVKPISDVGPAVGCW